MSNRSVQTQGATLLRRHSQPRVDPFLKSYFDDHARQMRVDGSKVSNAAVLESGLREFASRALVELMTPDKLPERYPPSWRRRVCSKGGAPIWMPTRQFMYNCDDLHDWIRPSLKQGEVIWTPSINPGLAARLPRSTATAA